VALASTGCSGAKAERDEFVKLFANLLEQTYIARIDEFGGEKLTYVGEQNRR